MIGVIVGTAIIATTSPLFVRSFVPRVHDDVRDVWVLQSDQVYRWRSEGYASTSIGPHGMMGRRKLPRDIAAPERSVVVVALWGDSQAEGVAVSDATKLFAQAEQAASDSGTRMAVLPLGRSGDDAADWLTQIPDVESAWNVDAHVILVTEMSDMHPAVSSSTRKASETVDATREKIAQQLPGFVVHAARNLLTESNGEKKRSMRFSLGPMKKKPAHSKTEVAIDWQGIARSIEQAAQKPVIVVYAPQVPSIVDGVAKDVDGDADAFAAFESAAAQNGIVVTDVTRALIDSARSGQWPHGFHNGQFGVGHLNESGYEIVADAIVRAVNMLSRTD